jgi:hypothetical protein
MPDNDPFKAPFEPFEAGHVGGFNDSEPKHSGLGIASFAVGLLAGLVEFAIMAVAGVIEASTPGGMDESSPEAVLIGMGLFAGLALAMLGVGLGIGGLTQRRKKVFAVLGVLVSLLVTLAVSGLIVVGLTME